MKEKTMKQFINPVALAVSTLFLTACGTLEHKAKTTEVSDQALAQVAKARQTSQEEYDRTNAGRRERVDAMFAGEEKEVVKPEALSKPVNLVIAEATAMSRVVSILAAQSGLSIRFEADAEAAGNQLIRPNLQGTLESVLQQLAASSGLSIKFDAKSASIFKFETAVLRSKRTVGILTSQSSIGTSGQAQINSGSGGASGSNSASTSLSTSSSFDPWKDLEAAIKATISTAGKYSILPTSGVVVVTDAPANVRRIERIIETDNALATHPITIKMEVISLQDSGNDDLGVNWNAVFARVSNGNPRYNLNFSSPASLSQGTVGSFRLSIPSNSGRSISNSDALITALAETGVTTTILRREFTSLHNVPASLAKTDTTVYRARTTPGVASSSGQGEAGVEPGQISTGIKLFLTPTWTGEDNYLVTLNYDDSFLRRLRQLGEGRQQIDAPESTATQLFSIAQAKVGYTTVVNALEIDEQNYETRGLSSAITTGSAGRSKKTRFFLLLTALKGPF
jgi:type IVB pilus formation R64 PilN family outer membrane protein